MKATVISILILFVSQVYGRDYQPLLSNGKSWTMVQTDTSPVHDHDAIYTCTVDRDTVINGQACKVVMRCNEGNCDKVAYMPVLAEGRQWKLSYTYRDTWQDIPDAYMTIAVDGDSIVDGKKCKKLLVDYRNLAEVVYPKYIVAYETMGRVYRIDEDREEHLVMDMNLHQGDALDMVQTILKEDTVIVDGIKRKRLMIDSGVDHSDGEYLYYMVEGIGISKDEFVNMGLTDETIYFHRLIACYDNGKCVFSAADFPKEGTNGLNMPKVNCPKNDQIYDLQGRKVSKPTKGVYIKNGKKVIIK